MPRRGEKERAGMLRAEHLGSLTSTRVRENSSRRGAPVVLLERVSLPDEERVACRRPLVRDARDEERLMEGVVVGGGWVRAQSLEGKEGRWVARTRMALGPHGSMRRSSES